MTTSKFYIPSLDLYCALKICTPNYFLINSLWVSQRHLENLIYTKTSPIFSPKPVSPTVFLISVNDNSVLTVVQGKTLSPLSYPPTPGFTHMATQLEWLE